MVKNFMRERLSDPEIVCKTEACKIIQRWEITDQNEIFVVFDF